MFMKSISEKKFFIELDQFSIFLSKFLQQDCEIWILRVRWKIWWNWCFFSRLLFIIYRHGAGACRLFIDTFSTVLSILHCTYPQKGFQKTKFIELNLFSFLGILSQTFSVGLFRRGCEIWTLRVHWKEVTKKLVVFKNKNIYHLWTWSKNESVFLENFQTGLSKLLYTC